MLGDFDDRIIKSFNSNYWWYLWKSAIDLCFDIQFWKDEIIICDWLVIFIDGTIWVN